MRRLESAEETERKNARNRKIISLVILGILVLSTLGFAFSFYNTDEQSQTNSDIYAENAVIIGNNKVYLKNSRDEAKNTTVNMSMDLGGYSNQPLYLDVNGNNAVIQEIGDSLGRYSSRIQEACYGKCERNVPEKTCEDNIIIWKDNIQNKVYQEGKCIFIEGDLRAVDAFLYYIFDNQ